MLQRREFVLCAIAGAALAPRLGLASGTPLAADANKADFTPSAWLKIDQQGRITVQVHKSEMGQGVTTALPMLIAEELGVRLEQIQVQLAPAAVAFRDAQGNQSTGYSSSISGSFLPLRELGAAARQMLLAAAAERWQLPVSALLVRDGMVLERAGQRSLPFAALIEAAQRQPVPQKPTLQPASSWLLLGKPQPRVDTPAKVDGSAKFAMDVQVPGMLIGVVARAPIAGATPVQIDDRAARKQPGVLAVHRISSGVVVLAKTFFAARKGRDLLQISWSKTNGANSAAHRQTLLAALAQPGISGRREGDASQLLLPGERELRAEYFTPFLAHAAMEPLACTAQVSKKRCDIWCGTQAPSRAQNWGAELTGLSLEQVHVHTHMIGGAFGRRGEWDFVIEAVEAANLAGRAVKIVWTREDDMRHDFYRPMTANRLRGVVSAEGVLRCYVHQLAGSSIARRRSPGMLTAGSDFLLTQGSSDLHYDIAAIDVNYRDIDLGVPVGFWRSVGHSHNGFVAESFIDELAHLAGRDPLAFRLAMLTKEPRMHRVLSRAAAAANWGSGGAQGVACMKAYGTYVALVATVRVVAGEILVDSVHCAVDCGIAVNPNIIRQQMESGIVFGLSAALFGEVRFENGVPIASNFHDYPAIRMQQSPRIAVEIIASELSPGGCGEPSTPVIAPAVANAVYAATGQRLRSLPLQLPSG